MKNTRSIVKKVSNFLLFGPTLKFIILWQKYTFEITLKRQPIQCNCHHCMCPHRILEKTFCINLLKTSSIKNAFISLSLFFFLPFFLDLSLTERLKKIIRNLLFVTVIAVAYLSSAGLQRVFKCSKLCNLPCSNTSIVPLNFNSPLLEGSLKKNNRIFCNEPLLW